MKRATKTRRALKQKGLSSFLVSNALNVRYLSGYSGSPSALLLLQKTAHLFVAKLNYEQAVRESSGCRVKACDDPIVEAANLARSKGLTRIGYETTLTVAEYRRLRRSSATLKLKAADGLIERVRMEKDEDEISLMKKSARITSQVMRETIPLIKVGVRELDVAAEIEYRFRKKGSDGSAFSPIVASGPNSSLPHALPGTRRIKEGDLVTIDLGCTYRGYASDMTRTFVVGKATPKQRTVYEAVRRAQAVALTTVSDGITCRDVDTAARTFLAGEGLADRFIHSLGHGLGLAVHEYPRLSQKDRTRLARGMIVTVEPGVYFPRWGGVRVEDTVLVRRNGADVLTRGSKRLLEL